MTISAAPKGQMYRLQTTIQTSSTNVTPGTITLSIQDPLGTTTTYTSSQMTNSATGIYYYDYTIPREGMFYYKWVTTGNGAGGNSGQFRGLDTPFD
jgi:hypothetical protein